MLSYPVSSYGEIESAGWESHPKANVGVVFLRNFSY